MSENQQYLKHYHFSMECIMDNKELKKLFQHYAINVAKCPETIEFMEAVDEYESKFNRKVLNLSTGIKAAHEIITAFVKAHALMEINIGSDTRTHILSTYEALEKKHESTATPASGTPVEKKNSLEKMQRKNSLTSISTDEITELEQLKDLFRRAYELLYREFLLDVFPRFLRSTEFKSFVHSKGGEAYVKKFATEKTVKQLKQLFTEEEEKKYNSKNLATITDQDVHFFHNLSMDYEHWKLLSEKKDYSAYISTNKYQIDKGATPQRYLKLVGVLPYNVDDVLHSICDPELRSTWEHNLSKVTPIDYIKTMSSDQYSVSILHENYPMIWPMSNRDFVTSNSIIYNAQRQSYYVIKKSIEHNMIPPRKGTTRGTCQGSFILSRVSDNKTRYVYCLCMDMKGTGSNKLFTVMHKKRFNQLHDSIVSCLKANIQRTPLISKPHNSFGLLDTLDDQKKKMFFASFEDEDNVSPRTLNGAFNKSTRSPPTSPALGSSSNLKRLVYISFFDKKKLLGKTITEIGKVSSENNKKLKITGMLLCCDGIFYQVLEGDAQLLDQLVEKIKKDPRHLNFKILKEEYGFLEHERSYPSWGMNTVNLDEMDHYFAKSMKSMIQSAAKKEQQEISQTSEEGEAAAATELVETLC